MCVCMRMCAFVNSRFGFNYNRIISYNHGVIVIKTGILSKHISAQFHSLILVGVFTDFTTKFKPVEHVHFVSSHYHVYYYYY